MAIAELGNGLIGSREGSEARDPALLYLEKGQAARHPTKDDRLMLMLAQQLQSCSKRRDVKEKSTAKMTVPGYHLQGWSLDCSWSEKGFNAKQN